VDQHGATRCTRGRPSDRPSTPATIYAASEFELPLGGVFKSTDGGTPWSASNTGLTSPFVTALAVDVQTPTIVYAGTGGVDDWGSVQEH